MKSPAPKYKNIVKQTKKLTPTSAQPKEKYAVVQSDVQGLITRGYKTLRAARYIFLKITCPDHAKQYFNSLLKHITRGEEFENANLYSKGDPPKALNIAFTAAGLKALGLEEDILKTFSREFVEGMSYVDPAQRNNSIPERSTLLGDMGNNSPAKWHWGNKNNPVDCVLMLYARDNQDLQNFITEMYDKLSKGVSIAHIGDTFEYDPNNIREHFGFKDGMSQPVVGGISSKSRQETGGDNFVKPGEFILGYENEYGNFSPSPSVDPSPNSVGLPDLPNDPTKKDLGKNGTYLVFRQLEQHVERFWHHLYRNSKEAAVSKMERAIKLAAKMVGRWPDGQPLVTCPDGTPMEQEELNNFNYADMDPEGLRCPFGAHIRRTNPRDQMHGGRDKKASAELSSKHRMLRRGRIYGEPLDKNFNPENMIHAIVEKHKDRPAEDPHCKSELKTAGDNEKINTVRGLHFICLVSDISRQFEFVQNVWANTSTFGNLCNEVDPIISPRPTTLQPHCLEFSTPQHTVRNRYQNVPEFTTVVGGEYFFMPGIKALNFILQ